MEKRAGWARNIPTSCVTQNGNTGPDRKVNEKVNLKGCFEATSDSSPHQVTTTGPKGFRTPVVLNGKTTQLTLADAVSMNICGLHPP
jgi:hypothetical protein